jgi:Fe-S-cluster containining protein
LDPSSALPQAPALPLVPDRSCGSCNVCCVALTIDDPALQKPQGYRCRNATRENACAIYDARPQTCRSFFCGWRTLKWIRPGLRPDRSGVLVRLHGEIGADGSARQGIMVTLLNAAALKAEGLAESIAAAVHAELPVYLHIPGPPGYTASRARLNEALGDAVHARDKAAILAILRRARAQGRAGAHEPIVLRRHPNPDDTGHEPA